MSKLKNFLKVIIIILLLMLISGVVVTTLKRLTQKDNPVADTVYVQTIELDVYSIVF